MRLSLHFKQMLEFVDNPPEVDPSPEFYCFTNPCQYFRQLEPPQLKRVTHPSAFQPRKTPLIFVHGMEYRGPIEIIRDIIEPFERKARLFSGSKTAPFEIYFVSWNSALIDQRLSPEAFFLLKKIGLPAFLAVGAKKIPHFMRSLEQRAKDVSRFLAPYFVELIATQKALRPIVLTHSLGSLVWSEMIHQLHFSGEIGEQLGGWLNLQPAIDYRSYCTGARYESIPRLYGTHGSRMEVWYSRLDIVLASIYLCAKSSFAMGQLGSPSKKSVRQRDVTWHAKEAHGIFEITPRPSGGFFNRVGHLMKDQLRPFPIS